MPDTLRIKHLWQACFQTMDLLIAEFKKAEPDLVKLQGLNDDLGTFVRALEKENGK